MRCLNPIRIKNPQYPENSTLKYIDCACRKCVNCLVNIRRQWYFRLFYESLHCCSSFFIGLDYAPENSDGLVHKRDLQLFFKRMRKKGLKFTYYSIGEYGTTEGLTHHPHYHILLFSDQNYTNDLIELYCREAWPFGRVHIGYVEPRSINYVLHYHVRPKRPFGDNDPRQTFCLMSKGLGLAFIDNQLGLLFNMLTQSNNRSVTNPYGDKFVIPRYLVRKLKDYGLPVKEYDGTNIDWSKSNLRSLVETFHPEIEFYPDGRVKEIYDSLWNKVVSDIMKESKRKLKKYDNQEKRS